MAALHCRVLVDSPLRRALGGSPFEYFFCTAFLDCNRSVGAFFGVVCWLSYLLVPKTDLAPFSHRRFFKGWLPHYKFLNEELKERFLSELIQEYTTRYSIQEDGIIKLPDCYLEVIVVKGS